MSDLLGRGRTEGAQGGQSAQLLMSLFLILLCFFVLLVGHSSSKQDRSQVALGSVARAFGGSSREEEGSPEDRPPAALDAVVTDLRQRLSSGSVSFMDGGGEAALRVVVPRENLFDREDGLLQVSEGIRQMSAQAVLREVDGLALELEIAAERSVATIERDALALDRVARDLIRRGVPPHRVSIALEPGMGAGVRFAFFVRPALPVAAAPVAAQVSP